MATPVRKSTKPKAKLKPKSGAATVATTTFGSRAGKAAKAFTRAAAAVARKAGAKAKKAVKQAKGSRAVKIAAGAVAAGAVAVAGYAAGRARKKRRW